MSAALTRRAALTGAAASLAVVGIAAATVAAPFAITASSSPAEWDAAFARWNEAQTAYFGLPLNTDRETDTRLMNREHEAWRALFETPAPHIGALHWKLHFLFGDEEVDGEWDPAITRRVLADAARLAKQEGRA